MKNDRANKQNIRKKGIFGKKGPNKCKSGALEVAGGGLHGVVVCIGWCFARGEGLNGLQFKVGFCVCTLVSMHVH